MELVNADRRGAGVTSDRPSLHIVPEPPRAPTRVCVIGGGIAGLAAAHAVSRAAEDAEITVLEESSAPGGKLRVSRVAGVPVDEGAEAVQAARPEAVALARDVALDRDIVYPEIFGASLWSRGKLRGMPPTVMGVPTDLRALTAAGVLPMREIMKLPLEYRKPRTRFDNDVSVGAFVESRLGREVVDTLVEPVLGGVYAGRADALSLQATVPALFRELQSNRSLLKAAEFTSRGGGRRAGARQGPVFAGIRGGVGRLPGAVVADLERNGVTVRTRTAVRSLHRVDDHWRVIVNTPKGQEVLLAEEIILAVPPHAASDLLSHICPPAANDLGLMSMSSMATVALAYPSDSVAPLTGSGFLVPPKEGRTVKAANYASSKWDWIAREARTNRGGPGSLVIMRASIGRVGEEEALNVDDRDLVAATHGDLAEAVGVSASPIDYRVTRWHNAIPQYEVGHVTRVERIRNNIANVGGLEICGAALDGVGVAAVIGSARFAARQVANRINQQMAAVG